MLKELFVTFLFLGAAFGFEFRSEEKVAEAFERGFLKKLLPVATSGRAGCRGLFCNSPRSKSGGAAPKIDLIFVVDSSGSVRAANFTIGKSIMKSVVDFVHQQSPISASGSRVACVKYSTPVLTTTQFGFKQHSSPAALKSAIDNIKFDNGASTATGEGLKKAKSVIDTTPGDGRVRLLWVLTDGNTNTGTNPVPQAKIIKDAGVEIFASPIGRSVTLARVEELVSPPAEDHIFEAVSFASAKRIANRAYTNFKNTNGLTEPPPTLPPNFFKNLKSLFGR